MVLSDEKIREYTGRLLKSRMRILCNDGFYGLLLMHVVFSLDENCETAATDGFRIYFGPAFLDRISDSELDFILMHEILHIALQHCSRQGDRDNQAFNIACDIVVNSNILLSEGMNKKFITLSEFGESMHIAPDGKEGFNYTAEEVYKMLPDGLKTNKNKKGSGISAASDTESGNGKGEKSGSSFSSEQASSIQADHLPVPEDGWDDHSRWTYNEDDTSFRDVWVKRIEDAAKSVSIRNSSGNRGTMPLFAQRILNELTKPQTDWRMVLNDFVQEEICDYSFSPPDRRFGDSPFFLPDFSGTEDRVDKILFMVDTSGSVSDAMLTAAYSEIKGAIDMFEGRLTGWVGFFDAAIIEPVPFMNEDDFRAIRPAGGGGTDFKIIFDYVHRFMSNDRPASIVILTDGFAPFPCENLAEGIPVLWLINNEIINPPWGKVARIKI